MWQVKTLASRWGEATHHAWDATESSCPRSQGVVAEARRKAGALVTGWYLSRGWLESGWRKIPDPWTPHRPCLFVIVETSGGTMWQTAETRWRLCALPPTPLQPSHTRPVACYFYRGACQPEDPPWGFHPRQLQIIFCLTSEACQPAQLSLNSILLIYTPAQTRADLDHTLNFARICFLGEIMKAV